MKNAILGKLAAVSTALCAVTSWGQQIISFELTPSEAGVEDITIGLEPGHPSADGDNGAIAGNQAKAQVYIYARDTQPFGRDIMLSDIQSIEYYTKKDADGSSQDWYLSFYTNPDGVDDLAGWYGYCINLEPYYSMNLDAPANQWNRWSSDTGTNQLRIFDNNAGGYAGGYTDPTLAELQAGSVVANGSSEKDYSSEVIKYISISTGNPWAADFDGAFDDIKITLTDGSELNVSAASGYPEMTSGWKVFNIRKGSSTGKAAFISADHDIVTDSLDIAITEGGQKVGLATDMLNGAKISQITNLHIDRLDDVATSGSLYGPYFNIWVTDGVGNYAVIANEPSNAAWADDRWDVPNWDFLRTKVCKVYETPGWNTGTSWLHSLVGKTADLTFEDVADLIIAPPPVAYIQDAANSVGSGAPDELETSVAHGFTWVFGDSSANYVTGGDGFIVNGYAASASFPVFNTTQLAGYQTLTGAVAKANADDVLQIAAGTNTVTGQLVINKNLTITGEGADKVTLLPAYSSGGGSYAPENGWIAVSEDVEFNLSGVTIDGAGQTIKMAIISRGTVNVDNCIIRNISSHQYLGWGVCVLNGTNSVISNSEFHGIQRIGVHIRGGVLADTPAALVENCLFVGKGEGDWVEYGVEFGGGGSGEVVGCTMSNFLGVASSDGSTSAGILATDYYGNGTDAMVVSNTISGNTSGIMIGYAEDDATIVEAHHNVITDNGTAVSSTPEADVDVTLNYFGDLEDYSTVADEPVVYSPLWTDEAMTQLAYLDLYVDDDFMAENATNFTSIASAVAAAVPGSTIHVAAGDYAGDVVLDKAVTLLGANAGIDAVVGSRAAESVITGEVRVAADGVTVDGFTVTNPAGAWGVFVKNAGSCAIRNNIITDVNTGSAGHAGGIYVVSYVGDQSDFIITGNNITDIGSLAADKSVKGINFGDANGTGVISDVLIQGNRIAGVSSSRGGYGIQLSFGADGDGAMDRVQVLDNIIVGLEGGWAYALALESDTQNTVVQGNRIGEISSVYPAAVVFSGNPSGGTVVLTDNSFDETGGVAVLPGEPYTVDASGNYWGGSIPAAGQTYGDVIVDTVYTDEAMSNLLTTDSVMQMVADMIAADSALMSQYGLYTQASIQEGQPSLPMIDVDPATGTVTLKFQFEETGDLTDPDSWASQQPNSIIWNDADQTVDMEFDNDSDSAFYRLHMK